MSENTTNSHQSPSEIKEEIVSAFSPGLKIQIWQRQGQEPFCVFDFNKFSQHTGEFEPMRFFSYNSLLLLHRLLGKAIDRMSYWHFLDKTK